MKSLARYLSMQVPTERGFVNITSRVEEAVRESGVREGLVLVNTGALPVACISNRRVPTVLPSAPMLGQGHAQGVHAMTWQGFHE